MCRLSPLFERLSQLVHACLICVNPVLHLLVFRTRTLSMAGGCESAGHAKSFRIRFAYNAVTHGEMAAFANAAMGS